MTLARLGHQVVGLGHHFESIVIANGDALGTAFTLGRIDDDVEHAADAGFLLAGIIVFLGLGPLFAVHGPVYFGNGREFFLELSFGQYLAEDGGIGTLGHTVHAAGAVFGNVDRNFRGN